MRWIETNWAGEERNFHCREEPGANLRNCHVEFRDYLSTVNVILNSLWFPPRLSVKGKMILKPPPQFTWGSLLSLPGKPLKIRTTGKKTCVLHGQDIKILWILSRLMLGNPRESWSSGLPAVDSVSMLVQRGFRFPIVRGIPEILWVVFLIPKTKIPDPRSTFFLPDSRFSCNT